MDLSKIITIPGMPGLYKVIGQAKNGVIVESLADKKRFPAFSSHRISALDDICIFTSGEDLPLREVYKKMFEKGGNAPDPKNSDEAAMRAFIETIVPDYDKERVHVSDLRKLFSWYNILQVAGLLNAEEPKENTSDDGEKKNLSVGGEKNKTPLVKKDNVIKQNTKTNAPKVKPQGVRKTGTA